MKQPIHDAFLAAATPHTECPDRYIIWSAFSVIGAVLKNSVHIKDGLYKIYPNQYIVLVGPPGIGKGTAVNFCWDVIRNMTPNLPVNMIKDRVTAPRILERIAAGWNSTTPKIINGQLVIGTTMDHTCEIFSTELGVLIGASEWMLEFLCESWDRNTYDYDTKNKGSSLVTNMCTSLIGGTVPDYLHNIERDNKRSIKGGFTSRCIFVYEDELSRYLPMPPAIDSDPQSMALLQNIKNDLEHISQNISGEYTYNTEARIKFENFIKPFRANASDDSEPVSNFKSRIRTHTLKLAMVLSAARKDSMVIDGMDMTNAIVYITKALSDVVKVFRGTGDSELASACGRVQEFVDKVGVANKKDILVHVHRHVTPEVLDRCLWLLTEVSKITAVTSGKTTLYKSMNGHFPKKGKP